MEAIDVMQTVSTRLVEGMMLHNDLADVFDFIGMRGYKRMQEYYGIWDMVSMRKVHRYAINCMGHILPEETPKYDSLSNRLTGYSRTDLSPQDRTAYLRRAMSKWIEWEQATLHDMESAASTLRTMGEVCAACKVECLVGHVAKELKCAMRKEVELSSVNYDLVFVMQEQTKIHDCYRCKTAKACKRL